MNIIENIKDSIDRLDQQNFRNYVVIFFVVLFALLGLLYYRYYRTMHELQKKVNLNNEIREERLQPILERYEQVKQQKADVDKLLAQDADFKIAGYFNDVIKQLGLSQNLAQPAETTKEELENEYTEIKLYANFTNLTMKNIVELLDKLEKKERIYTKEIEIYQPTQSKQLNLNIQIATLEPQKPAEETE